MNRQHRFMESSDINTSFRILFGALRTNVRRGMQCDGQAYGLEMDACIPGELLATTWLAPVNRGVSLAALLDDTVFRRAFFERLLGERRPETLFAYVCERAAVLYVELIGADGVHAAEYPIRRGRGWHRRDLVSAPHRRLGPLALA